jgi:hypothetical protein
VQAQSTDPSSFPLPVQVPLALIPLNFPAPLVDCHLFDPYCIFLSLVVAVNW